MQPNNDYHVVLRTEDGVFLHETMLPAATIYSAAEEAVEGYFEFSEFDREDVENWEGKIVATVIQRMPAYEIKVQVNPTISAFNLVKEV